MKKNSFYWLLSDITAMTKRNLTRNIRLPQLLVLATIQPIMFLLLFTYVFGGAISMKGGHYINYLLPGILVQTVLFGSMQTGIGLREDLSKGMIDRFKSLPMARSAVLAGRTLSDMVRNVFVVLLMICVGYVIGFRFEYGLISLITVVPLTVLFGYAFSWVSACIGMFVKDTETAQVSGFIWVFPLVFASSIFVPVKTMPHALRVFAEHNPISYTVDTVRALATDAPGSLTSLYYSLAWIVGILIVFVPIAVRRYMKS